MRIRSVRLHGIGPLDDFSVDLDALPAEARIIAVTGANGAGKSTFLEAGVLGACYRSTETRGSLSDLATGRDSFVETTLTSGKTWTIRHSLDCVSKKAESSVVDSEGIPALTDSKVRSFDAWAEQNLPSQEVLSASLFCCQGAGGFLRAKAGERKAVLLRLLGVEHLEVMAREARERAKALDAQAATLEARIADEERRGGDVATAEEALRSAKERAEIARQEADAAALSLAAARELANDSALARQRYAEQVAERRRLEEQLASTEKQLADVRRRIVNNETVLSEGPVIRAKVDERNALQNQEAELAAEVARLDSETRVAAQQMSTWTAERTRLRRERETEGSRVERLRAALAQQAEIEAAVEALPSVRKAVEFSEEEVRQAEARLEELSACTISGAEERITELRGGLREIAVGDHEGREQRAAQATLDLDDREVAAAQNLPGRLAKARQEVAEAKHRLAAVLRERSQLDSRAALAGRLEEDRKALADATRTIEEVKLSEKVAAESWTTAEAAHGVAVEAAAKASLRLAALRSDIEALRPWLAKCEPLAGAKSRLEELRPQEERLSEDVAALTERLSEPPPSAPEVGPNVAALQATSDAATKSLSDALRDVGAWEGRLSLALRSQEAVGALRGKLGGVRTEQADWTRLGLDLGRDGLQAALIDAAVPELGEMTNDLLRATVGARWTVTFETQRASSDGKKLIEGLEVRVIDTEAGREGEASTLSGGEATLLGEAVSLALAMLACRRSGEVGPTIVRDESGAALDPEKRPHYVAMLRRAADIVGASRVLIVSHSEDVVSLCDAVVEVGGGK